MPNDSQNDDFPNSPLHGSRAQVQSHSWRIGFTRVIEVKTLPLMVQRAIYERSFGQSVQQRSVQARRRAPYLNPMAQDLPHLGVGDNGQHPHFRSTSRANQRINLVDLGDQPRPCGARGSFGEGARGRLGFRGRAISFVNLLSSQRGVSCYVLPKWPRPFSIGSFTTAISSPFVAIAIA